MNGGILHGRDAAARESYGNGKNIRLSVEKGITAGDSCGNDSLEKGIWKKFKTIDSNEQ